MELILQIDANKNAETILIDQTIIYDRFNNNESEYHKKYENKLLIKASYFSEEKKVRDCIRKIYSDQKFKKNSEVFNKKISDDMQFNEGEYIVLILESPHKDEYDYSADNFIAHYPANGRSGININKYFNEIFEYPRIKEINIINKDKIIICNPIQWQTSLHFLHRQSLSNTKKNKPFNNLRNEIWKTFWKSSAIKKNFIDRISNYKPKIIINACTSDLKDRVQTIIKENISRAQTLYEIKHPSSWHFNNKNRELCLCK